MTWSTRVMNWCCVSSVRVRPRKLFAPVWLGSGWYASITPAQRERVTATLSRYGIDEPEVHWALIRLVFASPAVIAMIQVQDALGLGSEGRMNQPGSVGAWGWRLDSLPSADVAARLREATAEAGRLQG